ncbi:MAG TPA: hypothetical protein VF331_12520 [Polyangiales bacterium]
MTAPNDAAPPALTGTTPTPAVPVPAPPALPASLPALPALRYPLTHTTSEAGAAGTIALTTHEIARPTPALGSVPPALGSIVTCAMSTLMGAERMPLFTGPEGQKHALRVRFLP